MKLSILLNVDLYHLRTGLIASKSAKRNIQSFSLNPCFESCVAKWLCKTLRLREMWTNTKAWSWGWKENGGASTRAQHTIFSGNIVSTIRRSANNSRKMSPRYLSWRNTRQIYRKVTRIKEGRKWSKSLLLSFDPESQSPVGINSMDRGLKRLYMDY